MNSFEFTLQNMNAPKISQLLTRSLDDDTGKKIKVKEVKFVRSASVKLKNGSKEAALYQADGKSVVVWKDEYDFDFVCQFEEELPQMWMKVSLN